MKWVFPNHFQSYEKTNLSLMCNSVGTLCLLMYLTLSGDINQSHPDNGRQPL